MNEAPAPAPDLIRNYKRARKFPHLIGRTHTGGRIPGGPYTPAQFIGALAVVGVLVLTYQWWTAWGSWAQNMAILIGLPMVTVFALGKLPQAGRNPFSVAAGVAKALTGGVTAPSVNGRPQRPPRAPRALIGVVTIAEPAPVPTPVSAPAPAPQAALVTRGLGSAHLLALAQAHARRAA